MDDTSNRVNRVVIAAKVSRQDRASLELVSVARGENSVSETMRNLIREEIEKHYPGATTDAA